MIPADLGLPARFTHFRPRQLETATELAHAMDARPYQILRAPTGSGKTMLAATLGAILQERYLVLTPVKGLQLQMSRDFCETGLFNINGHSSYSCYESGLGDDDIGECADSSDCKYKYRDLPAACAAPSVITNVAHWVQQAKSERPDALGKFGLLVVDEAHKLRDLLVGMLAVKLSARTLSTLLSIDRMPAPDDDITTSWLPFLRECITLARQKYARLKERGNSSIFRVELAKVRSLGISLRRAADGIASCPWIVEPGERGAANGVTLTPVWADKYTHKYVFRSIPRVLLCSATIDSSQARYLGLAPGSWEFRDIPSTFMPSRSPLYIFTGRPAFRNDFKINQTDNRHARTVQVRRIARFAESRVHLKGLIHSRSYENARMLHRELSALGSSGNLFPPDYLWTHDAANAKSVVAEWMRSPTSRLLISPSMEEGYDLADDLCRYYILWKVPFPDRRNKLNRARRESDKSFENEDAKQTILQQVGRPMRSEGDWCDGLILDDHFRWFRNSVNWPASFRSTWREVTDIPTFKEDDYRARIKPPTPVHVRT